MLLTDAHQGCPVMSHHRHSLLPHGAWMTFVTSLAGAACQQAGDVTFHHWAALATGTGQLHVVRGPLTV